MRIARLASVVAALGCGGIALVTACSTFSSDGDNPTPVVSDAGADATESREDASPEASADGGDGGCLAFKQAFSSDVDLQGWMPILQNGAVDASSSLPDGAAPTSAPAALFANGTIPDSGPYQNVRASLTTTIPFLPSSLHVRYALQVPASSPYAEVGCALHLGHGPNVPTFDVFVSGTKLQTRGQLGDGGDSTLYDLTTPPASSWIDVDTTVLVDRDAGSATATVRASAHEGGSVLGSANVAPIAATSDAVEIECGVGYADFGGGSTSGPDRIEVLVDDLDVTACH